MPTSSTFFSRNYFFLTILKTIEFINNFQALLTMRKRQKKKSRLPSYIMMGVMVAIMVGSFGTVMLYAPHTSTAYNGQQYEFDQNLGMITTTVDDETLRFHSQASSAATIPYDDTVTTLLSAPVLTVTFDPQDTQNLEYYDVVRYELALAFPKLAGATTQDSDQYALPILTCEDATAQNPIIELSSGEPAVLVNQSVNENCIMLTGNLSSVVLAKDALLYNYYGLI